MQRKDANCEIVVCASKEPLERGLRDVVALLDRVRERGSPIMADRVQAVLRKFFNWCIGRGILDLSPRSGVTAPPQEQARHRTLTDDELTVVLEACPGDRFSIRFNR